MRRVLPPIAVIGGCRLIREREAYDSIEILDAEGARMIQQMKQRRRGPAAMAISKSELLIVGGCSEEGVHLRSIEKVDLDKKNSSVIGEVDYDFSCAAFCPLQDGRLFIAGGFDGRGSIRDVCAVSTDGKFEKFRNLPSDLKNSAAIEYENKVFLFGGWDGRRTLTSIIVYDAESQEWEVRPGLPDPIECHSATLLGNGVFLVGGYDSITVSKKVYRYDLVARKCEELPASLTTGRENHFTVAARSEDGKTLLLVIGGWNGREALNSIEVFEVLDSQPWLRKISEDVASTALPRNKPVALTLQ